jgi:hypothetical protein
VGAGGGPGRSCRNAVWSWWMTVRCGGGDAPSSPPTRAVWSVAMGVGGELGWIRDAWSSCSR